MASRRQTRQWAMQILFELDVNPVEARVALDALWSKTKVNKAAREYVENVVLGTVEHGKEIDDIMSKHAENWKVSRMHSVDRCLMRLALYEMLYRTDIPPVVSINEAVELAKEFGDSASGKFINGILDRARSEMDRPAREASDS